MPRLAPFTSLLAVVLAVPAAGDVVVITGKDKGRTGRVVQVLPAKGQVIVEGVRRVSRRHGDEHLVATLRLLDDH